MLDELKEILENINNFLEENLEYLIEFYNDITVFLKRADSCYRKGEPIISDFEFDEILKNYEKLYEKISKQDTSNVEVKLLPKYESSYFYKSNKKEQIQKLGKVFHGSKLLGTLSKQNSFEELKEWILNIKEKIGFIPTLYCELKYDGNSVVIVYDYTGKVVNAFSRGKDGTGENLYEAFKNHKVPANLCEKNSYLVIRYEALLTDDNFEKFMDETEKTYANNRSATSGILGRDDKSFAEKYLSLAPLDIAIDEEILPKETQYELIEKIIKEDKILNKNIGLNIIIYDRYIFERPFTKNQENNLFEKIKSLIDEYNNGKRFDYDIMVDGLVFKISDPEIISQLDYTNDVPNWATAFKFKYLEKSSIAKKIHLYVGKSGRMTPVIEFEPIEFFGAIQRKVSLANYKRYQELAIAEGDEILIEYRNDVISYVSSVIKRSGNPPLEFDPHCPKCGEQLYTNENETFIFCINEKCPSKILGKIEKFFIQTNTKGIGYATINKLYNENIIKKISDFYTKSEKELFNSIVKTEGFKELSAKNIINAVYSIKNILYDYEIVGSLSIPNIGKVRCKEIFKLYDINEIITFIEENKIKEILYNIEGFSKILINNFIEGVIENKEEILILFKHLNPKFYKNEVTLSGNSKTFVITGELKNYERDEVIKLLSLKGHKVTGSVSKKTDFLVTNNKNLGTVKLKKALELGIPIIDEDTLIKEFLSK